MTLYLLDTNAISELVANPSGKVARKIAEVGAESVATSVIVSAEVMFGLEQKASPRLEERIARIFSTLEVLPLEQPADKHYGELRAMFKKQGRPIGPNDLFIAAHALTLDATVISANLREFSRVPGLKVEDWLQD